MEKMKIVSFTYCEDVQNDSQGRALIIGPMQLMAPKFMPTDYSFNISFGIFDVPKEGFLINTEFLDPNGSKISENTLQVPTLPVDKINLPNLPFGIQVNIGFRNVPLLIPGEYNTVIKLNGKECGKYPIEVCHEQEQNN